MDVWLDSWEYKTKKSKHLGDLLSVPPESHVVDPNPECLLQKAASGQDRNVYVTEGPCVDRIQWIRQERPTSLTGEINPEVNSHTADRVGSSDPTSLSGRHIRGRHHRQWIHIHSPLSLGYQPNHCLSKALGRPVSR